MFFNNVSGAYDYKDTEGNFLVTDNTGGAIEKQSLKGAKYLARSRAAAGRSVLGDDGSANSITHCMTEVWRGKIELIQEGDQKVQRLVKFDNKPIATYKNRSYIELQMVERPLTFAVSR